MCVFKICKSDQLFTEMATKNLTEAFLIMRNNAQQSRHLFSDQVSEDTVALVTADSDAERGVFRNRRSIQLPIWLSNLNEVNEDISQIRVKLKELDSLHDRHINRPTFNEDSIEEQQIELLTERITQMLSRCGASIGEIRSTVGRCVSSKEKEFTQNVVKALATSLQNVTNQFRCAQTTYCHRIKSREDHSNQFFEVNIDDAEAPMSPTQQQQDLMFLHEPNLITSEEVLHREEEVRNIVRSIHDLNVIFKEVATMVAEQGTVVDRIDYNIDVVETRVQQGLKQLQRAETYQRKNRKMICILVLAALCVVLIIVLFITKL